MKKLQLIFVMIIIMTAAVLAQPAKIKITSNLHPKYIIEEIWKKPYILYFNVGKFYYNAQDWNKAEWMFKKAIEHNPDFVPAYHNLGTVYYEKGNYEQAAIQFKKATEIDPEYLKAYYSAGILHFKNGNFDKAIDNFLTVVRLEPNNPNYIFDLAQGYVARFRKDEITDQENYDDLEKALTHFSQVEKLAPGFPHALTNINIIKPIIDTRKILLTD
ncbi:MAG: tetratricopeptide repeat protein [Nanoarchaeota archaeon]